MIFEGWGAGSQWEIAAHKGWTIATATQPPEMIWRLKERSHLIKREIKR